MGIFLAVSGYKVYNSVCGYVTDADTAHTDVREAVSNQGIKGRVELLKRVVGRVSRLCAYQLKMWKDDANR